MDYRFRWSVTTQEIQSKLRTGAFDNAMEALLREYEAKAYHQMSPIFDCYETILDTDDPEVIYPIMELFEQAGVKITVQCVYKPLTATSPPKAPKVSFSQEYPTYQMYVSNNTSNNTKKKYKPS